MTEVVTRTEFRNAMARVCAPVHVITTEGAAGRGGFTATAMCSVTGQQPDMAARYAAARWTELPSGNPALSDAIVSFDCVLADLKTVGSHNVLIGQVVDLRSRKDGHALLYFDRNFVHVPTEAGSFGG